MKPVSREAGQGVCLQLWKPQTEPNQSSTQTPGQFAWVVPSGEKRRQASANASYSTPTCVTNTIRRRDCLIPANHPDRAFSWSFTTPITSTCSPRLIFAADLCLRASRSAHNYNSPRHIEEDTWFNCPRQNSVDLLNWSWIESNLVQSFRCKGSNYCK